MEIVIENETGTNLEKYYQDIDLVVNNTLVFEKMNINGEVSITFVHNKEIRELNKKHRKNDKATDVLSFPMVEDFENIKENEFVLLGDIVISLEKAEEQAEFFGHSIRREITFLVIHSMLHLLGYDHMVEDEEKIMIGKQKEIFRLSNIGKEIIE